MHLWQFRTKIAQKPWLHFFTNFATKTQKANPPNLAKRKPKKINSFCKQTFHTSFCIHLWQFPTKIAEKPWLHFFTNFATKAQKANPANLAKPKTQPRSIAFATKLLTHYFGCFCDNSPPRLLKNHDFTFSPILLPRHKKPIHPTWPSQNPTKINSFWNQTFHTSFCILLGDFPTNIAQKPWLHFSPILLPRHKN